MIWFHLIWFWFDCVDLNCMGWDLMIKDFHKTIANCVKNMRLGTVVPIKILILLIKGVTILRHMVDYVTVVLSEFYSMLYFKKNHNSKTNVIGTKFVIGLMTSSGLAYKPLPMVCELQLLKYHPMALSVCQRICWISNVLGVTHHWSWLTFA